MTRREHATRHPVDAQREAGGLDQLRQFDLSVRPPHPPAGNDRRALGCPDEARDLRDRVWVGRRTEVRRQVLGRLRHVSSSEKGVEGDVH